MPQSRLKRTREQNVNRREIGLLSLRDQLKLVHQESDGMNFEGPRVWIGDYCVSVPNRLRGVGYDDETGEAW